MWLLDFDADDDGSATNASEQIDVFKSADKDDPVGRYPTRSDFALPRLPNVFADAYRRRGARYGK